MKQILTVLAFICVYKANAQKADTTFTILFSKGKSEAKIDILNLIKEKDYNHFLVYGYTDSTGSQDYNQSLATSRNDFVVSELKKYVTTEATFKTFDMGESDTNNLFRGVNIFCFKIDTIYFSDLGETLSETFKIAAYQDTILLTSNHNLITINAYGMVPVSNRSDSIYVTVTEYLKKSDLLFNNLTTTSNGKMLISDGMFDLRAKGNNNDSVIIYNYQLDVMKKTNGMSLFYPEDPSSSDINWIINNRQLRSGGATQENYCDELQRLPKRKLKLSFFEKLFYSKQKQDSIDSSYRAKIECDSIELAIESQREKKKKERQERRLKIEEQIAKNLSLTIDDLSFYTFDIDKYGIINVDKFYDYKGGKKSFTINSNIPLNNIYLIFSNINSMLPAKDFIRNSRSAYFYSVPLNEPFNIVALGQVNNQLYYIKLPSYSPENRNSMKIKLKPIELSKLTTLIKDIK